MKTEAEKFAEIAIKKGVPRENIYLEKESTNTGDNFRFSKKLIEKDSNIILLVVGDGPELKEMKETVYEIGHIEKNNGESSGICLI